MGHAPTWRCAVRGVAGVALAASMLGAAEPEPRTLESLLADPVSPGVIVLLLPHVKDARVREVWSAGLRDERAAVRAVAARAIGVTGVRILQPGVRAALDKESDEGAAAEEAAALVMVSLPTEDGDLLAMARAPFAATLALTLAQVRGAGVRPHLARIAALGLEAEQATEFFLKATRRGRADAEEMAREVVRVGDAREIEGFFAAARRGGFPVVPDALEAALSSSDRRLSAAACWHVAFTKLGGTPMPESLRTAAVKAARTPVANVADAEAAFACDVAARTLGSRPTADGPWLSYLAAPEGNRMPSDVIDDPETLAALTEPERRAVATQITGSPDGFAKRKDAHGGRPKVPAPRPTGMRLASGFTPGLVADTLRVAGCAPGRDGFAGAQVFYQEDGRPHRINMIPTALSPGCHGAASALLALATPPAQPPSDPAYPYVLLLNLDRDAVSCADEVPSKRPPSPRPPGRPGHIIEPRKVRNISPVYPSGTNAAGTVIIDSVIGTSGCIRSAEVVTAPDDLLAWSALRAVSRWMYTPVRLDGAPIPVVMTITVNYRH